MQYSLDSRDKLGPNEKSGGQCIWAILHVVDQISQIHYPLHFPLKVARSSTGTTSPPHARLRSCTTKSLECPGKARFGGVLGARQPDSIFKFTTSLTQPV